MDDPILRDLAAWVTEAGLAGTGEAAMLAGFGERAQDAGLPLASLVVVVDTLHPTHEGHAIRWRRSEPETVLFEYGRTNQGDSGETYLRERLSDETLARYWNLEPDRDAGMNGPDTGTHPARRGSFGTAFPQPCPF